MTGVARMNAMPKHASPPRRQQGVASLLVALVLLVATTLMVLFTARSAFMEQRISGNEIRAKQAMQAAQAGLDYALAYLGEPGGLDQNGNGTVDTVNAIDFDSDGDGTKEASFRVLFCNTDADIPPCPATPADAFACDSGALSLTQKAARVVSCGWSDDNSARHVVTSLILGVSALSNPPTNPLIAKGTAFVGGSASVVNQFNNLTVWSGNSLAGASGLGAGQTFIRDPDLPPPPLPDLDDPSTWDEYAAANPLPPTNTNWQCNNPEAGYVCTTNSNVLGPDVIESDSTLAHLTDAQFFEAFFGMSEDIYRATLPTREVTGSLSGSAGNEVIWVDASSGTATLSGTFGSRLNPVVLIVDGNAAMQANTTIYGVLFVTGDLNVAGTPNTYGVTVVRGSITGSGSMTIFYDPLSVAGAGQLSIPGLAPGTWRDWPD